jgi:hypothetical protein
MATMFPCVGAGALPTLRGKIADGGAIMTQLALPGSGVAGQYRSLSKKGSSGNRVGDFEGS